MNLSTLLAALDDLAERQAIINPTSRPGYGYAYDVVEAFKATRADMLAATDSPAPALGTIDATNPRWSDTATLADLRAKFEEEGAILRELWTILGGTDKDVNHVGAAKRVMARLAAVDPRGLKDETR